MKSDLQEKNDSSFGAFQKSVFSLFEKITKPKSTDEDSRRREFILNILLLSSIVLSAIFSFIVAYQAGKTGSGYRGFPLSDILLVFFGFVVLYLLARARLFVFVSYFFTAIFFVLTTYTVYHWGADVPMALLSYAFIIVMAGILIGTRFAFGITVAIALIISVITYLQLGGIIHPNLYWKPETLKMKDSVQFSIILLVIAVVSWLSNREIERSLKRARRSEAELKDERDMLEVRVQERTKELEKSQAEKMNQAARFIDFGKISSGLFHDLINHLNFLFLNIEQAGEKDLTLTETKNYLKQADETKQALAEYIEAARKQFQNQKTDSWFSVKKEILSVIKILGYRFTTEKIGVSLKADFDIITYGNAVRFNHIATNVILNSLDAYEIVDKDKKKREIEIRLDKIDKKAAISIEDWAGGIPEGIQDKVFESFFTTKSSQRGTGIGLSTAKNIIEEDFGGTISFQSVLGQGTKFIIEFPIRNEQKKP